MRYQRLKHYLWWGGVGWGGAEWSGMEWGGVEEGWGDVEWGGESELPTLKMDGVKAVWRITNA